LKKNLCGLPTVTPTIPLSIIVLTDMATIISFIPRASLISKVSDTAQIDSFGNFIAVNENNNKIYTKTVTLDGLKNQILYYNYLSSEENIGAAVIDQLSNKLYLRGQTGIFVVSDVGSSIPEFESGILVVAASSIVMVISLQKYRKS